MSLNSKQSRISYRNLLLATTLVIILINICFLRPSSASQDYGDALIVGSIGDASNLIPMLSSDATSHSIASLIIPGLVKYDKNLRLTGDLAKSWEISPDGKTITFYLRDDAFWEDGTKFTAHDIVFGVKTILDPNTPTPYAGDFLLIDDIQATNDYTLVVKYKEPFAPALGTWSNVVVLPRHILEGKDIKSSPLGRKPLSLGPFTLESWKTQEKIVLKANNKYYAGRPYIDKYIHKVIPDLATMFLELKSGNIDMMSLTPIQYSRLTNNKYFNDNFKKYQYLSFSYTYLGFNLRSPLFADKRVRRAIYHAIDKKEIVDGVLLGLGVPAQSPYKPDSPYFNSKLPVNEYDPERAKRLLHEAGWEDKDGDGILEKNGVKFSFTILTNQGNDLRLKTAQIIQYRLKKIGINVNIRTVEWTAFIKDFIDKRRFEAVILGWTMGIDPDQYDIWHSSRIEGKGLNFIGFKNPEVDTLLEEGRKTFDFDKRRAIYERFQEILYEEQPYVFLYYPMALPIIHKRFKGIEPAPAGISHNLEKWYVPKSEQKHLLP